MVELKNHVPLSICVSSVRTCWDSHDKGGCYSEPTDEINEADKGLLQRVILKHKHASTAEHLVYNFSIFDVSRALLQELSRHRMASPSVKSTRYTLKELKSEEPFTLCTDMDTQEYEKDGRERAEKYLVMTSDERVNRMSILALDNLRDLLLAGVSNDIAKFALPESYKTELSLTINARSLQNFLALRTSKAAMWEIRNLANDIYNALPGSHKFLFESFVAKEINE